MQPIKTLGGISLLLPRFEHSNFLSPLATDTYCSSCYPCAVSFQLPRNKPLARRAARESIVLLRNRGHVLPFVAHKLLSVAVVGPSADSPAAYIGDYAPQPAYYTTVYSGAKAALPHATLRTAPGCLDIYCGGDCPYEPCSNATD
eukprot:SAG31_NODE_12613_length_929_cov_1.481928_1_plen_144_part_10